MGRTIVGETARIREVAPPVEVYADMQRLAPVADEMRKKADVVDRQVFAIAQFDCSLSGVWFARGGFRASDCKPPERKIAAHLFVAFQDGIRQKADAVGVNRRRPMRERLLKLVAGGRQRVDRDDVSNLTVVPDVDVMIRRPLPRPCGLVALTDF